MSFPAAGRGAHITRDMFFPGRGTHITRDILFFLGKGTHITSDMCFLGRRTRITRDMSFLGRGTHITTYMCFPTATIQRFQTLLHGMFGITAGCDFPSNAIQFMPCLKAILIQQKQLT